MTKKKTTKATWADIQARCGLDEATIQMAQRLGMSPRSVLANQASTRQERWKAPTADWIQDLYRKRFGDAKPGEG